MSDDRTPSRASLAFKLEQWRQAILDQWDRILEDDREADKTSGRPKWIAIRRTFTDVHFLFISIRQILELRSLAAKSLDLEDLKPELLALESELAEVKNFRDYGEHLANYILGVGKHQDPVRLPDPDATGGGLWMPGDSETAVFSFGGKALPLEQAVKASVKLTDHLLSRLSTK